MMKELIANIAQTNNIDVISRIIATIEKHGRVYVVGKLASDKAKTLIGDTVIVSDECNVVCCGVS